MHKYHRQYGINPDDRPRTTFKNSALLTPARRLSKPNSLVPPHISNRDPSYFICAGLVFTVCCEPYLQSEYGGDYTTDSPVKLLDRLFHGFPKSSDEEVVVLSQVLACDATLGYEDIYNVQVRCCGGLLQKEGKGLYFWIVFHDKWPGFLQAHVLYTICIYSAAMRQVAP